MKLLKYNEMAENSMTYGEFFKTPGVYPSFDKYGDEKEFALDDFKDDLKKFENLPINFKKKQKLPFGGFFIRDYKFNEDAILVFDEAGNPEAYLEEYELSNPFAFRNILVLPGHDSITCYDIETRKSETFHIR